MTIVFETKRLLLRLFTENDSQLIYALNQDPEVIKFTHDPIRDLVHAKEILQKIILPQYYLYNHGRWAIHLKKDLEFIGWCGLKHIVETGEIDLGYRLKKEFWGNGYATEAALATIKHGFEILDINRIVGKADPENKASCAVLEKCGLTYKGIGETDGFTVNVYEICKQGSENYRLI